MQNKMKYLLLPHLGCWTSIGNILYFYIVTKTMSWINFRNFKKQTSISSAISSKIKGVFKPSDPRSDEFPGIENIEEADTVTIAVSQKKQTEKNCLQIFLEKKIAQTKSEKADGKKLSANLSREKK